MDMRIPPLEIKIGMRPGKLSCARGVIALVRRIEALRLEFGGCNPVTCLGGLDTTQLRSTCKGLP